MRKIETEKYLKTFRVNSFDSDRYRKLKLHSLFEFFSEIGWDQAKELNVGFDDLIFKNKFWILTSIRLNIINVPVWQDEIDIYSWPSGRDGIRYIREYEVFSKSGDLLIQASSNWIIFDGERHRPVIPKEYEIYENLKFEKLKFTAPLKLDSVDNMNKLSDEMARYTDIDMNQHVNNSVYIRWIENNLDQEKISEEYVFEVQFIKELLLNDKAEVFGKTDNNVDYFEIKNSDNNSCVRARFIKGN